MSDWTEIPRSEVDQFTEDKEQPQYEMPDSQELASALTDFFSSVERQLLPTTKVESFHSCYLCEDGETTMIYVDMVDGSTAVISVTPGEQIICTVHE